MRETVRSRTFLLLFSSFVTYSYFAITCAEKYRREGGRRGRGRKRAESLNAFLLFVLYCCLTCSALLKCLEIDDDVILSGITLSYDLFHT